MCRASFHTKCVKRAFLKWLETDEDGVQKEELAKKQQSLASEAPNAEQVQESAKKRPLIDRS